MDAMVALNPLGNDKTQIDTFIRLYQDYIDELRIYDPTIDKLGPRQIAEIFLVPELDIHLIVLNEAVIGFKGASTKPVLTIDILLWYNITIENQKNK